MALLIGGCDGCFKGHVGGGNGCGSNPSDGCFIFCGSDDDDSCRCNDGTPCPLVGDCADEDLECDDPASVCAYECCSSGTICSHGLCVPLGEACTSSDDCAEGFVCGHQQAATVDTNVCLGGLDGACIPAPIWLDCDGDFDAASAPTTSFAAWGSASEPGDHVVGAPVVVQLDDDDCDGRVDWRDVPDVIFMTASTAGAPDHGRLVYAAMESGLLVEKGSVAPGEPANDPTSQLAAARVGDEAFVIACTEDDRLRAYDASGLERWLSAPLGACDAPTVGVVGAGSRVVVAEGGVVSLVDGGLIETFSPPLEGPPLIVDVASPVGNEILGPTRVFDASGQLLADLGLAGTFVAAADLDADGATEIVTVASAPGMHHFMLWRLDAADEVVVVHADVDVHGSLTNPCLSGQPGESQSGGPPSLVDVDGDGVLDVVVASAAGLVVFDGGILSDPAAPIATAELAAVPLDDCSHGRRAVSAFDFDADGFSEIVASDGARAHIVSILGANVVWSACSPTEPSVAAFPIVDVDANGSADLLTFASARENATCDDEAFAGVQIFSGDWAGAPRVWLQHQQPGLPLESAGEAATPTTPGLRAPAAFSDAPDVSVTLLPTCSTSLRVLVENTGLVPLRAGTLTVELAAGDYASVVDPVASIPVPVALDPGASAWLEHPFSAWPGSALRATVVPEEGIALAACTPSSWSDDAICAD